jgi:hypothetical protein
MLQTEALARREPPRASEEAPGFVNGDGVEEADIGNARRQPLDIAQIAAMPLADDDVGNRHLGPLGAVRRARLGGLTREHGPGPQPGSFLSGDRPPLPATARRVRRLRLGLIALANHAPLRCLAFRPEPARRIPGDEDRSRITTKDHAAIKRGLMDRLVAAEKPQDGRPRPKLNGAACGVRGRVDLIGRDCGRGGGVRATWVA